MNHNRESRKLEELNIIDNFMFNELTSQEDEADSIRFCTILLETLLDRKLGNVRISSQKEYQGIYPNGHGICMDVQIEAITLRDGEEVADVAIRPDIYDIEPNRFRGADEYRTRYYTALIDSRSLQSGVDYDEMKNIYIIMITPYDPFGKGSMVYTIRNHCQEFPDMPYEDGVTSIFLYTKGNINITSEKARSLLRFIENSTSENARGSKECQTLLQMMNDLKHRRKVGVRYMKACEIEKHFRNEGREEGREEERLLEISRIISVGRKYHASNSDILVDLQTQLSLSPEKARECLNAYDESYA